MKRYLNLRWRQGRALRPHPALPPQAGERNLSLPCARSARGKVGVEAVGGHRRVSTLLLLEVT